MVPVILAPTPELAVVAVRAHARVHLARLSVPRDVVLLDELLRNATGKVVARHLPSSTGPLSPGAAANVDRTNRRSPT